MAVAALLVALVAGGIAGWRATRDGGDPLTVARAAAHRAPEFRSSDPSAIALWCSHRSDRRPPPVDVKGLKAEGARVDWSGHGAVVTVLYATPSNRRVAVSWLDAYPVAPAQASVEARTVASESALVLRSPAGTAAVEGRLPLARLWEVAAHVQQAASAARSSPPLVPTSAPPGHASTQGGSTIGPSRATRVATAAGVLDTRNDDPLGSTLASRRADRIARTFLLGMGPARGQPVPLHTRFVVPGSPGGVLGILPDGAIQLVVATLPVPGADSTSPPVR